MKFIDQMILLSSLFVSEEGVLCTAILGLSWSDCVETKFMTKVSYNEKKK